VSLPGLPDTADRALQSEQKGANLGRNFLGIISLGCMIENLWLTANSLGIEFQIVSGLANGPVGN